MAYSIKATLVALAVFAGSVSAVQADTVCVKKGDTTVCVSDGPIQLQR